jgi:prefoldin beta subunit
MNDEIKLTPQTRQILMQMQTFQQQIQTIAIQKESLNMQNMEIERALEELKKVAEKEEVYRAVGPMLIKSTKKDLEKDLGEKKETISVRLKSLEKQDDKLKEKMRETQKKLEDILKTSQKESSAT